MSSRAVRFDDFVLQLDTSSRGGFRARVLKSRFGETSVGFSLPSFSEPIGGAGAGTSRSAVHRSAGPALDARPPLEVGTELFRAVFQGQLRTLFDKSRGQLEMSPDLGLRLKIKIDPGDEDAGALADLPWELLCDAETEDFFVLSRQLSLVRYLDVPRPSQPIPFAPPLRILAVGASPQGVEPLDLEEEAGRLERLNGGSSGVEVRVLLHATAGKVREALSKDACNVLHFMGHGTFDPATGEGMLAFEKADGTLDLVSGRAFANKLKDVASLGVVVLNACDTARARHQEGANPFRGVATALVLGGVPAVVAMRMPISDDAAIGFSTAFYRHLAQGDSIDEALTEGRQAIHSGDPDGFEWATPVLFLRTPEGNVFTAKPAERLNVVEPVEPVPAVVPLPAQAVPKRGSALRIAAGVAGAGLVSFVLYTQLSPSGQTASGADVIAEPTPVRLETDPAPTATAAPVPRQRNREPKPETSPERREEAAVLPVATPTPAPPAPVEETPAPTANLSSLLVRADSIARGEQGGLRVTVTFTNQAALPLSAVLDGEGSVLSDEQGQRYGILGSSLASWRLELAPGATSRHTFDFQAPKLNSTKFLLALRFQDGGRMRATATPLTLEGPP
ncbi:MAG: CHAT domain-containing protein [Thermoanaerobaculia bacterium]